MNAQFWKSNHKGWNVKNINHSYWLFQGLLLQSSALSFQLVHTLLGLGLFWLALLPCLGATWKLLKFQFHSTPFFEKIELTFHWRTGFYRRCQCCKTSNTLSHFHIRLNNTHDHCPMKSEHQELCTNLWLPQGPTTPYTNFALIYITTMHLANWVMHNESCCNSQQNL